MPPSTETIYALLKEHMQYSKTLHDDLKNYIKDVSERTVDSLDKLNGQVGANTKFRHEAKIWFAIAGTLFIGGGSFLSAYLSKFF